MAGAGTGLPTQRGQVASTITDTAGYGAGEAAAAEGFARAAEGLGKVMQVIEPAAQQASAAIAEQEVAAGQFRQRALITPSDAAFNEAMNRGTMARLSNDADADLAALRTKHLLDPDGYAAAAAEYRRAALGASVPASLAAEWAPDFDRRSNNHLSTIRNARALADLDEAKGSVLAQIDRLTTDTVNIRPGATLAEVLADPQAEANMMQIALGYANLAGNPAFGMSPEEVDAKQRETMARIKAGAVSAWATETLRTQGADAALEQIQGILTDETIGDRDERQLAFNAAREAVNQEVGLANQRRAQAESVKSAAEQDMARLIGEDVAGIELTGTGTGLTEDQVRAVSGNAGVSRWLKARADATDFHNMVGSLPLDDPDAAAAQISNATAARGFNALPAIADDSDLGAVISAMSQVETPGRSNLVSRDPDGAGPAGGGAYGDMQVLPATAQRIAAKLGLPYDQNRLLNDVAYNQQIGREYMKELVDRYRGDTFLAITAYHAGEGNVDGWLRSVGDPRSGQISREAWLNGVESRGNPRSAEYPRKVLAALNAGRANATWDAYQGQRSARAADPASTIQRDFTVQAARQRWTATPNSTPAAEAYVAANLAAQERANIAAGSRRTLPGPTLVVYAGDLERFARAGDTAGYQGYADSIVRRFGGQGAKVLQDVLETRGDTRFAAQVAARATAQAQAGARPPQRAQAEAANTAGRANTMARAATGTSRPASAMTDAEVLAAAGLSQ